MMNILDKIYITDKEAASRYGHSQSWFRLRRHEKKEPHYVKLNGRILYPRDETDAYFENMLKVLF